MDVIYTIQKVDEDYLKSSIDFQREFILKNMTPDMILAMQAGCNLVTKITPFENGDVSVTISTVEKVSILKTPDGTPISILVKRDEKNRI